MFEFRCKKCKNKFAVEQHPLFQSLIDKLIAEPKGFSGDEKLKAFYSTVLDITKQIQCQKCLSTVYLVGINGVKIDKGIDATSEPFVITIKGLVDLHKEYKSKTTTPDSFLKSSDEVSDYAKEIAEHLMWHPGELLYFEDSELMSDAKMAIEDLWKNVTFDELFDEMHSGGFSGLLVSLVGDYIDRAKMIKPTFITIKPSNEIKTYFQQAMDAWSHGLDTAALILSCSILEAILKQVLCRKGLKLVYDFDESKGNKGFIDRDFDVLIKNARKKNILDDREAKKADNIRRKRNAAVHKLKQFSSADTYKAIITTKELLEKLLTT